MAGARTGTALLLLSLTGCVADPPAATQAGSAAPITGPTSDASPGAAPEPSTSPAEPVEPAERRCDHPTQGYSIGFPADWHVAGGDGIEPCTFFSPEPLTLEPNSEATGVAIRLDVRDVPFDQARREAEAEGEQTVEERTVTERAAVRLEGVLTEEVLLPAGTRVTTWLVELDAGTLLLTTDDAGEDDYEVAVGVLDEMVAGLQIP